ncbi:response regulator transcription factor [Acidihalobacter ferrooxydans]|uniref:DNA-binding response regulator n=1 Tax=Acidihalobacter ferrooxydans TaxID=1765967 RepID=A0A1P8UK23_9GAMM|nr:response regulator transcription factor [Acidihalobacter ferrooxydans]APZ44178.1 DNA-binding response regulator [Acidihalobacter ferrooxydans]
MNRVLLVDDDVELCEMLGEYLSAEGFDVLLRHDAESGVPAALGGDVDAVVLDIMMPGQSGLEALREIRQQSLMPVLMLTAKGDDVDRIVGLELGADDYLPKPCNPRELVARLRAVLRRSVPTKLGEELSIGPATLRPAERLAEWAGEALPLTSTEFNLLEVLMRNVGHVVSKDELSERALGHPLARYDRSVDVHISNLRRKLGNLDDGRSPIQTVRGLGYQYVEHR